MEIKVKVHPESSSNRIIKEKEYFEVFVKAKKKNNLANQAVISLVSKYLSVPPEQIKIIKGKTGKNKILEVK
jgi:uncharacterized protein YggU (UPF0235/DUF167 family)